MSCLFPGVDPFLEPAGLWPEFHLKFLNHWQDTLTELLPETYEARLDERVRIVFPETGQTGLIAPDLAVLESPGPARDAPQSAGPTTATILEPATIRMTPNWGEEVREVSLHILRRPERQLVTVLELLSPSHKESPGRDFYLRKRAALLQDDVNLFELDLLKSGQRILLGGAYPSGDFHALLARANDRPWCKVYSWTVQQRLPVLPVPLRAPDADLWIDLQEVFERAYERGRYQRVIDTTQALPAAWDEASQTWIRAQVREAGRTT